jgi:hypothetical protein
LGESPGTLQFDSFLICSLQQILIMIESLLSKIGPISGQQSEIHLIDFPNEYI